MRLEPTLHRTIGHFGDVNVDACFNCGDCTAICNLSDEDHAFPRRMMHYLQIGNREKLLGSVEPWLSHHCEDCSVDCPREARPSDVVNAVRAEAVKAFAFPSFMGRLVASPRWLPVLFLFPLALFAAFALALRGVAGPTARPEFANLFPVGPLEVFFFTLSAFIVLSFAVGLRRLVKATGGSTGAGHVVRGLLPAAKEILTHTRFAECDEERSRYLSHLLTFAGFLTLVAVSSVEGVATWLGVVTLPLPLWDGHRIFASLLKISANAGGLVLLAGLVLLLASRYRDRVRRANTTYFDWLLLWLLVGIVVTGFLSQGTRLLAPGEGMFGVYFVHLTLVFMLLAYMPFSKFAHVVYRTVAMAAARKPED